MTMTTQQFGPITFGYYIPSQDGWNTAGVDGGANGSFLNPDSNLPPGFLPFGSRAITDAYDDGAFLVVAVDNQNVVPSTGWAQVWDTEGIDGGENGFLYVPTAPPGYVALGVAFTNYGTPTFQVACVSTQYVTQGEINQLWSTAGIDGGDDLILYTAIIDSTLTPPSSDLNPNIAIPSSTFVLSAATAYLLDLPTPFVAGPASQSNPPRLSGYTSPGAVTATVSDGYVTLPYTLVDADSDKGNAWKALNSPFYTLNRTCYWTNVGFLDNQLGSTNELSQTVTTGVTHASSTEFSHTVGITVGAEGGVSFLGTGGKISVSVNYQFGYTTSSSLENLSESSNTIAVPVPAACAGIIWLASRQMSLSRTNGSVVDQGDGGVLSFNGTIYVTDQYPNATNGAAPQQQSVRHGHHHRHHHGHHHHLESH